MPPRLDGSLIPRNELAQLPEPILLVLDDFHTLHSPEVLDTLAFLIDHMPPSRQPAGAVGTS